MDLTSRPLNDTRAIVHQILVVDDDKETTGFLKTLLEQAGYSVTVAGDGGQAHSSFVMHRPDFVILDLILPGESGFEVCERMKQREKNVPILILSAIDMHDARQLAIRVGADGYMTKPVEPEKLLASIISITERVWLETHEQKEKPRGRVRFQCRCGKRFKVRESHRGKSMSCPQCGEPMTVPQYD